MEVMGSRQIERYDYVRSKAVEDIEDKEQAHMVKYWTKVNSTWWPSSIYRALNF